MLDKNADSDQSNSCRLTEAVETSVQSELLPATAGAFRIQCFENNPAVISYYTGFNDYEHFMLFYQILGPAVYHLRYKCVMLDLLITFS